MNMAFSLLCPTSSIHQVNVENHIAFKASSFTGKIHKNSRMKYIFTSAASCAKEAGLGAITNVPETVFNIK